MTAIAADPSSDVAAFVRLHVTPLDADLLKVVLSSTLLPKARNISYHTIETFPEKRYGFLELPQEDAEKLRRKLNGSVLKGVKIRIESARPSATPAPLGEEAMAKRRDSEKGKEGGHKANKRKRDADLEGVVLEEGRKVKRGWTTTDESKDKKARKDKRGKKDKASKESKKEKKRQKSKYTDHEECLIKTVLPANAVASAEASETTFKKKGKSREIVVHEFERTTKFPTFLKTATTSDRRRVPLEFVEGRGWVDGDGSVVEAVKTRPKAAAVSPTPKRVVTPGSPSDSETSEGDGVTSEDSSSDEEEDGKLPVMEGAVHSRSTSAGAVETHSANSADSPKSEPVRPKSSGSAKGLTIKIPPATPKEPKVHPLEALYKRPAPADGDAVPGASEANAFSFFGNAGDGSQEEDAEEAYDTHMPMTPFTRQEVETRGIRSAAPTPDTAHPSRRFKPWDEEEDDVNEDGDDDNTGNSPKNDDVNNMSDDAGQTASKSEAPTSDFQKWFWENRGEINRSWKKRRKLAGKEKRYRENKARSTRGI